MFYFVNPADAEKKVITGQEDIEHIYQLLESAALEDKETEPVAGGSVTSFRFNLSGGMTYEVIYSSIAARSGRIMVSDSEKDYFTSSDIESVWNNCDYTAEKAAERELPVIPLSEENTEDEVVEFHGQLFHKSDLTEKTLKWLEWYNSLSQEEQLAVNSIPADLYTSDDAGTSDSDAEE
nr:hypothetical protein [Catenibacillus scindens]